MLSHVVTDSSAIIPQICSLDSDLKTNVIMSSESTAPLSQKIRAFLLQLSATVSYFAVHSHKKRSMPSNLNHCIVNTIFLPSSMVAGNIVLSGCTRTHSSGPYWWQFECVTDRRRCLFSLSDVETNRLRSHLGVPERNLLWADGCTWSLIQLSLKASQTECWDGFLLFVKDG